MDCKQTQSLLSAYADNELDARSSIEVEEHLRGCSKCREALEGVKQVKQVVLSSAPAYRAPSKLRKSIQTTNEPPRAAFSAFRVTAFAATVLLALFVGWTIGRRNPPHDISADLLASHVRALMSDHLADVISTDKHTVKPWFNGRIDYSPPVVDLAAQGFPLKGGRLEYLDGRRVAVLVYARNKHVIDLYVEPSGKNISETKSQLNGFNMRHWSKQGFEYWAVSDVNDQELSDYCDLLESTSV